jgi:hypothetical protein
MGGNCEKSFQPGLSRFITIWQKATSGTSSEPVECLSTHVCTSCDLSQRAFVDRSSVKVIHINRTYFNGSSVAAILTVNSRKMC